MHELFRKPVLPVSVLWCAAEAYTSRVFFVFTFCRVFVVRESTIELVRSGTSIKLVPGPGPES